MLMSNDTDLVLRILSHTPLHDVVLKVQALADQVQSTCSAIHEGMENATHSFSVCLLYLASLSSIHPSVCLGVCFSTVLLTCACQMS